MTPPPPSHAIPIAESGRTHADSAMPVASQPEVAQLLTSDQLVRQVFSTSNTFDRSQIAAAIEQLTKWAVENGMRPKHESLLVAREVGEANIAPERLGPLVAQVRRRPFAYEWVLPAYQTNAAGFRLIDSAPEQAVVYRGGIYGRR